MGTVEENFYNRVYSTGEYGGRGLDGLEEEAEYLGEKVEKYHVNGKKCLEIGGGGRSISRYC